MLTMKSTLLAAALAVGGSLAAGNASAASFEVYSGGAWTSNGTTHLVGPTNASYLGNPLPCNADFTLQVTGGVATVTAASFSGSTACASIISRGLPWTVTIGAGGSGSWALTVGGTGTGSPAGGVNVRIPFPGTPADCPSATGRAPVNGTFTDGTTTTAAVFQFPTQALGPCSVQSRSTPLPGHLRTTGYDPARIVP